MPNYTPTPWTVIRGWSQQVGDCYCIEGETDEQAPDNQRLIEGAMDLLAALKDLRGTFRDANLHLEDIGMACDLADAAIAKAEGTVQAKETK